jgi:hypothetical protein
MSESTVTGQEASNTKDHWQGIAVSSGGCLSNFPLGGGLRRSERKKGMSSLLERLSVSRFPYRFPRWYALLLELRTFYHRIQLLRKRGRIAYLEMGPAWEASPTGGLVPNKRAQARSMDMQQLLSLYCWLSPEDCHVYLLGWDAGEGYALCNHRSGDSVDAVPSLS